MRHVAYVVGLLVTFLLALGASGMCAFRAMWLDGNDALAMYGAATAFFLASRAVGEDALRAMRQ